MIKKKRTWHDCEDQKVLAIFNEIKDEAKRLYPQYFENTVYKFYIDSSTSHLGRCAYELDTNTIYNKFGFQNHFEFLRCKEVVILLSKYIKDEKVIRSTLIHEFGHAVTPNEHHSRSWQNRTNKIGAKFGITGHERLADENSSAEFRNNIQKSGVAKAKYQYTVKCTCCGKEVHRKKMCSLIQHPFLWKCGACGGAFERIK